MKKEFLDFVNELMKANPEITKKLMTDEIQAYLDILKETKDDKPILTENGRLILEYLQNHPETHLWKAKDVADQLGISSRGVSGAFRNLFNDGFCEKLGKDPVIYSLTEKGKNFNINFEGENN